MAIKLSNPTLESFSFPRAVTARSLYSEIKKLGLPGDILKEIIDFSERNLMTLNVNNHEVAYDCCPNCLKAHILKRAEFEGFNQNVLNKIKSSLKSKIGHNGYYMNENKVFSIAL